MDLANQLCFFVGAAVGLAVGLAISGVVNLATGEIVLIKTDIVIGFFRLFLW